MVTGCLHRNTVGAPPAAFGAEEAEKSLGLQATARDRGRASGGKGLKALGEAVILQAMDDLWSCPGRDESIAFFSGEGFDIFAGMAGMTVPEQLLLLRILAKAGFEIPAAEGFLYT